jgi:hypothetical protein
MYCRTIDKSTLLKSSPRYIKIVILLFCLACVNSPGPEDCIGQEIESDSFWVYEGTCLKNSELGLDEDGVRKVTKEEQYKVFSECLPDNPEVDFNTSYVIVIKVTPRNSFPYIQEIKLIETCDKQFKIQIEIIETMFQEANVFKFAFVTLPVEIPEPKIEIIWL